MRFFCDTPDALVLVGMLASKGHVLHTTDADGECRRVARSMKGATHCRVPSGWQPALDLAARFGGSGKRDAAVALAVLGDHGDSPVDLVVCEPGHFAERLGLPVVRPDDLEGAMQWS